MPRDSFPPGSGVLPELDRLHGMLQDPALERAFQKENFELSVRKYVRFSVPLAFIAFWAYGVHDLLVIPEVHLTAWAIRFGLAGPIGALLVAFVFRNRKWQWHQPAMLVFGLTVNAVVLSIGSIAPPAGFFIYTGFAAIFVTLGPFLARMNVRTQVLYTALTLVLYNLLDVLVAHTEPMFRLSLNLTLFTLGAIGALAARQLEIHARLAFLQRQIIREQMAALDVERHRSESLLLNVLPRRIAERLKNEPDTTIADRFQSATVLFSDIVGFTELSSRLAPDDIQVSEATYEATKHCFEYEARGTITVKGKGEMTTYSSYAGVGARKHESRRCLSPPRRPDRRRPGCAFCRSEKPELARRP